MGALIAAGLFAGCASAPKTTREADGLTYREDRDLQKVWMADGFSFNGYDALYIAETKSTAKSRSKDEEYVLQVAQQELRNELANAIRTNGVFKTVTTKESEIPSGAKVLKMENTITEHEKGGGGARYFAGVYGAGQPVIVVNGKVVEGDKPVFQYISRRSGDSGGARMFGAFRSDVSIQEEDIKDLARDMAAYIKRASVTPAK